MNELESYVVKAKYPNFLNDPSEFEASKQYWEELCAAVLDEFSATDSWSPWLSHTFPVGEKPDMFPLWSLINREQSKGVLVNQQDPRVHKKWTVTCYVEESGFEPLDSWPAFYLIFNCNLTEETARLFREALAIWINPKATKSSMEEVLVDLLP